MKDRLYRAYILNGSGDRVYPIMDDRNFDVLESRSIAKAATLSTSASVHFSADGEFIQSYKVNHPAKAGKERPQ